MGIVADGVLAGGGEVIGVIPRLLVEKSPVHGELDAQQLVAWVLEDRLPVRVNLQLHKYVWGADAQGV